MWHGRGLGCGRHDVHVQLHRLCTAQLQGIPSPQAMTRKHPKSLVSTPVKSRTSCQWHLSHSTAIFAAPALFFLLFCLLANFKVD